MHFTTIDPVRPLFNLPLTCNQKPQIMSYKIKSFIYLGCFIAAFTVYSFSGLKSTNNFSDSTEIAIAEVEQVAPTHQLNLRNTK